MRKIFKDLTCYLIGGGPSLKDFDFNLLTHKKTISINKAFLYVPNTDVLYWSDSVFYNGHSKYIHKFNGLKVTNKPKPVKEDIINLKHTGRTGLELDPSALRSGNNSGYAAINLAYHLGAKNIVLLGYDMACTQTDTHFHGGYDLGHPDKHFYERQMIPYFESLVQPLKDEGVNVFNANPESKLECFPKITLEQALNLV